MAGGARGRRREIGRIQSLLSEVLGEYCLILDLIENAASMDAEPRELMTEHIGHPPVRIEAGAITHCCRDRLYWVDERLLCEWQGVSSTADGVKEITIPGGPGPAGRWLKQDLKWQGDLEEAFRLLTFLRCVPRRAPGQFPTGLQRCSQAELRRWQDFEYCYAPYQFLDYNCIEESDGSKRPPISVERELLLDDLPGHTITARVTRARKLEKASLETARCALLGNSFQCVVVGWIIAHWAVKHGYLPRVPLVEEMRELGGGATIEDASVTLDEDDVDSGTLVRQRDLEAEDAALDPSIIIVEELARRAEARGSDIRLDAFEAMRPDLWPRRPVSVARWSWKATAVWKWKRASHITDLQVRATLGAHRWRFRSCHHLRTRFCHLMDSHAGLGVVTRGRSSSYLLHTTVRRIGALILAALARPVYGYTETDRNPADNPTR